MTRTVTVPQVDWQRLRRELRDAMNERDRYRKALERIERVAQLIYLEAVRSNLEGLDMDAAKIANTCRQQLMERKKPTPPPNIVFKEDQTVATVDTCDNPDCVDGRIPVMDHDGVDFTRCPDCGGDR